jgi:hypothetical protein
VGDPQGRPRGTVLLCTAHGDKGHQTDVEPQCLACAAVAQERARCHQEAAKIVGMVMQTVERNGRIPKYRLAACLNALLGNLECPR